MLNTFHKWFKKEPPLPPADLSVLKTDIHSHLIPGIDDGTETIEESLEIIKGLSELGYKKLITTPHIMTDDYKNTPEIILNGLEKLREAVKKENINIQLEAAAEYYLDYEFEQKMKNKELLTFGDNYVLFEISFINELPMLAEIIFNMQTAGYKPVLAHPERYGFWYNNFDKYRELKGKGVLLQLNIPSILGYYLKDTKKICHKMIDEGLVDMLGTDCHSMNYVSAIKENLQEKYLHKVLEHPGLLNKTL